MWYQVGPCLFHGWTEIEPQVSMCQAKSSTSEPNAGHKTMFINCTQPLILYLKVGGSGVQGHP